MLGNRFGPESTRVDEDPVVIGLFRDATDARWALQALHESHYTPDQITAAFQTPADSREMEGNSVPMRGSGKWFGQLREIYRGEVGGVGRTGDVQTASSTESGFEVMLAEIDLSPQDKLALYRDSGRGAAIVAVKAGARNEEARGLLEQRGAHIVHGRHASEPTTTVEPASAVAVHSTPFNPPSQPAADRVQLFGEVLRVRKEKVSTGDVHVRKEAVTHMETVQVPVTREHLVVEHADENGHADSEHAIRVPLSEERVYIDKDTVLREEYKVGKREMTQNESVTDTVRRERLLIDDASVKTRD
jgi:uncharacterized protein (TIGR02271 family)